MAEMITTGVWTVEESKQDAFLEAWQAFTGWAATLDGASALRIGRDTTDARRFVSFGVWESANSVRAWKATPEFREGLARVLQHVDDFQPSELDVLAVSAADARAGV
jgi:heme-degrading monooxygenase HmoA